MTIDRLSESSTRILEMALREALVQGRSEIEPVDILRAFHRNASEVDCARIGERVVQAFITSLAASRGITERGHR